MTSSPKLHFAKFRMVVIFALLAINFSVFAQDMNAGFKMLEQGHFENAETFFGKILKDHPDNKTALLCFGRATGLSGNTDNAIKIFEDLLETYPGDLEVLLNLSEAYLWKKDGHTAIEYYAGILANDSTVFAATLGIANSYSMVGDYATSYEYIQKALQLDPSNAQAALSKKFIILGLANKLASEQHQYEEAIALLQINFEADPEDQESLALLANIYLIAGEFENASSAYSKMKNYYNATKGLSVALHLLDENDLAFEKAIDLKSYAKEKDTTKMLDANLHFVTALLWKNEIVRAGNYVDSLINQLGQIPDLTAAEAQVAMYEADFTKGVNKYTQYLLDEPKSFSGNLGKADGMHALGLDNEAYHFAFNTLIFYPGQKDASNFIDKLNAEHSPKVYGKFEYGRSSDKSSFTAIGGGGSLGLSPLIGTAVDYTEKEFTAVNSSGSSSQTLTFSAYKQLNAFLKVSGNFSFIEMKTGEENTIVNRNNWSVEGAMRISKIQKLTIGYKTEVQDFNEALLKQNLKTHHILAKNSMFWKLIGLGSYTEAYRSYYSDGNARNLIFTSIYKNLSASPGIKSGVNLLLMTFKESKPTQYYSPEIFKQVEVFAGIEYKDGFLPFDLMWDIAAGYQFLIDQTQSNWRTQLMLQRKIGRLHVMASAGYSSIAAAVSNGFSFFNAKGKITYQITSKPIFYKKIKPIKLD